MKHDPRVALIIGSGPNATDARDWSASNFHDIVAINNAWRVRKDWTHLIHPDDFPVTRMPTSWERSQTVVRSEDYVPATNAFGGMVYAGGTMAFTAGYWALHALRPDVIAFIGCDMVYRDNGPTHFYGTGTADPLRRDPTLQNLSAKAARLQLLAAIDGCQIVNLSNEESRLVFPRAHPKELSLLEPQTVFPDMEAIAAVRDAEVALGYYAPDGRYWATRQSFDEKPLADIDAFWLDALQASTLSDQTRKIAPYHTTAVTLYSIPT